MNRKGKSSAKGEFGQDRQRYMHDVVTDALPFELPQQQNDPNEQDLEDVTGATGTTIYGSVSTPMSSMTVKSEAHEMGFLLEDIDREFDFLCLKKNGENVTTQELVDEILRSQDVAGASGTTKNVSVSTQTSNSSSSIVKLKVQEMGFLPDDINKAYEYLHRKKRGENVTA